MNKRRLINTLQNLTLLALTASALFLLTRPALLGDSWLPRVQSIFSADQGEAAQSGPADLTDALGSVHFVATGDIEYGRFSCLYLDSRDASLTQVLPLFQEALGSALTPESVAQTQFQKALSSPGFYLDLRLDMPMDILCAWLGEAASVPVKSVEAVALTAESQSNACLYLCARDGTVTRCATALPVSAVREAADRFSPNGGSFAFESGYATLSPRTVLVSQVAPVTDLQLLLPDGYSAYNLLTALDFNPHTNYRYNESGGAEVVYDSTRSLRISQGGTVSYTGDSQVTSSLYHVSHTGEAPTAVEALSAALHLASALSQGTGAAPLTLLSAQSDGGEWVISFGYQAGGLPILLPGGEAALTVTITGSTVTAMTYHCRTFRYAQTQQTLLPPSMAVAVASLRPGGGLDLAYLAGNGDEMTAQWLGN